jgi:hypothetical protein
VARDMKSDVSKIRSKLGTKWREESMMYIIVWFMIFTK